MTQCKTDVCLVDELRRGHRAFEEPAGAFHVVRVEGACVTNISSLVLPSVWLLAAVRNLGSSPVTLHWSCCDTWTDPESWTALAPWPAQPLPPLGGRYALPCRNNGDVRMTDHPTEYHDTWLHVSSITPITLEILTAERLVDDTSMYTSRQPGVAFLNAGYSQWASGMFTAWFRHCTWNAAHNDKDLIRKAKWAATRRLEESAAEVGKDLLMLGGNAATIQDPGAHWSLLREWGVRIGNAAFEDLSAQTRLDWNNTFKRYGSEWLLVPDEQYTQQSLHDWRHARACTDGWWVATDIHAVVQLVPFAIKLQRAFRRCLADPSFAVCRRRLEREFRDMIDQ